MPQTLTLASHLIWSCDALFGHATHGLVLVMWCRLWYAHKQPIEPQNSLSNSRA